MKKITLVCLMMACAIAALADYAIVPVDAPIAATYKTVPTQFINVGKVIGVQAFNVVSNKTIVLYQVYPAGTTNTISTLTTTTTTGGNQTFDLSTTGYFWLSKGETWLRGGTETNATVRLIIEQ